MKKILILILLFIITGCNNDKDILQTSNKELQKILSEEKYIIVDVRTNQEYELSHVVDAINIPYDEIDKSINLDKDKTIIVYCMSGTRSNIVYGELKKLGYNVYDLGAFNEIDLPKE